MQAAAEEAVEGSPGEQDSPLMQAETGLPASRRFVDEKFPEAEEEQEGEEEQALPAGYISRRTTDPYMQKKLRGIQVQQPVAARLPKFGPFQLYADYE